MKNNSAGIGQDSKHDDPDDEAALAARAAWLYHAGGLTQAAVAKALGVTGIKVHRLLTRALRDGMVHVLIDGSIGDCIQLEQALRDRHRLGVCRVVPTLEEAGLPLRALGQAGAAYIRRALEGATDIVVGVGHGRSLAACIEYLPRIHAPGIRLVSLLGGLPRLRTASPYEMIQAFAERTQAEAWLLPAPFFANEADQRDVLIAQRGVGEAFALAREASLCLVGIGEVSRDAFLSLSGAISEAELVSLQRIGAVGEVLGRYFDAEGKLVATSLHKRVIAASLQDIPGLIAIAGGPGKEAAVGAVLRSGLLAGLITDEVTARRLLASDQQRKNPTGDNECTRKPRTQPGNSSPAGSAAGN